MLENAIYKLGVTEENHDFSSSYIFSTFYSRFFGLNWMSWKESIFNCILKKTHRHRHSIFECLLVYVRYNANYWYLKQRYLSCGIEFRLNFETNRNQAQKTTSFFLPWQKTGFAVFKSVQYGWHFGVFGALTEIAVFDKIMKPFLGYFRYSWINYQKREIDRLARV